MRIHNQTQLECTVSSFVSREETNINTFLTFLEPYIYEYCETVLSSEDKERIHTANDLFNYLRDLRAKDGKPISYTDKLSVIFETITSLKLTDNIVIGSTTYLTFKYVKLSEYERPVLQSSFKIISVLPLDDVNTIVRIVNPENLHLVNDCQEANHVNNEWMTKMLTQLDVLNQELIKLSI